MEPDDLFRLSVKEGKGQGPIPLRAELNNIPLFRRAELTVKGTQISTDQSLTDDTLYRQMTDLGKATGMSLPTSAYTFRRGNGEALDSSSRFLFPLLPSLASLIFRETTSRTRSGI